MPGTILDTGNEQQAKQTKYVLSWSLHSRAAPQSDVQADMIGDECYRRTKEHKRMERDGVTFRVLNKDLFDVIWADKKAVDW